MDVVSNSTLSVASLSWFLSNGAPALTVIVKATFKLSPGESRLAPQQEGPNEEDAYWDDDPQRSLSAATDFVPYKARPDVVVTGNVFAAGAKPVRSLVARVRVAGIDKAIEVHADRAIGMDGVLREGMPFAKMRLRYERAAGGPETENPTGMRFDLTDSRGNVVLPNFQPLGAHVARRGDVFGAVGLGPIAPSWPLRATKLHYAQGPFSHHGWNERPLPDGIDPSYFNMAPADQRPELLRADDVLSLEHLHPEHARLETRLSPVLPRASVRRPGHAPQELALTCDTLSIDTDRGVCHLVWRGTVRLAHVNEPGRILVTAEGAPATSAAGMWAPPQQEVSEDHPGAQTLAPGQQATGLPFTTAGLPFSGTAQEKAERVNRALMDTGALPFQREGGLTTQERGSEPKPTPFAAPLAAPPPRPPPPRVADSDSTRMIDLPSFSGALPLPIPPPSAPAPQPQQQASTPAAPPVQLPPSPPALPPPVPAPPPRESVSAAPLPPPLAPPSAVSVSPWALRAPSGAPAEPGAPRGSIGERLLAEAPPTTAPEPPPSAQAPAPRPARRSLQGAVDLVWFDAESVARLRKKPAWRALLTDLERANAVDPEENALGNTPEEVEDRRDVLHLLVHGDAAGDYGIEEAMEHAIRADGKIIAPLLLTAGQLSFSFDELEMLKATLSTAMPFAPGDEPLTQATQTAKDFLSTPGLLATGVVIDTLTARIREAFTRVKRPVAPDYLQTQSERALLEKRHYQKREVFSQTQLRGSFLPQGGKSAIPTYLPDSVSKKLPLYQQFSARLIVEVHRTADQNEVHPTALRALALGRVIGG